MSRRFQGIVLCFLCASLLFSLSVLTVYGAEAPTDSLSEEVASVEDYWPMPADPASFSAIIMEANTGIILYEKNAHERLYPASITKIMTGLLALENSQPADEIVFSRTAVFGIDRSSSHIARDVDEIMTMEQTLYATLVVSANECAMAIAEKVGGTVENFATMMNERAVQAGALNTHFTNPTGLPDENHVTTAYDMAMISKAALERQDFRTITGTKEYVIPPTNKHPEEETFLFNHHRMIYPYGGVSRWLNPYVIGGKTGYTQAAQATLVTFEEREGMTMICVIMQTDPASQYSDTRNLLDYAFDNFQIWDMAQADKQYALEGLPQSELFGSASDIISFTGHAILPKSATLENISSQMKDQGEGLVSLEYTYADRVVGTADIEINETAIEPFPFEETESSPELNPDIPAEPGTIHIRLELIFGILGAVALGILLIKGIPYVKRNYHFNSRKGPWRKRGLFRRRRK